jgi:hypothetical protein
MYCSSPRPFFFDANFLLDVAVLQVVEAAVADHYTCSLISRDPSPLKLASHWLIL